jgi:hypothetical protein
LFVCSFFSQWCGSCQQFKPVYADFADALFHEPSGIRNVVVTRVDCTLNPETCTARQVQAYPSVQFFRDGAMIGEYVGDRSVDDLLGWVEELSKQADLGAGRHHQHQQQQQQQQQQHAQQKKQRPSKDGTTAAAAAAQAPPQGQAQASAGAGSGKTSGAAPSGSILPDWRLSDLTDLVQLKRHIAAIADLPMVCTHILRSGKTMGAEGREVELIRRRISRLALLVRSCSSLCRSLCFSLTLGW